MVYRWGTYHYKADPNEVGKEIEAIESRDGEIKYSAVVDAARNEQSVMHDLFEWNDAIAGEKYREYQARQLVHNLVVTVEESEPVRQWVNIETGTAPGQKGRCINITKAMQDDEMQTIVLRNALMELKAFRNKYAALKQLQKIFEDISVIVQKYGG